MSVDFRSWLLAASSLLIAACSADDKSPTPGGTSAGASSGSGGEGSGADTGAGGNGVGATGTGAQPGMDGTGGGMPINYYDPEAPKSFVHPGIGLTLQDLDGVKEKLSEEPWKTGYDDMLAANSSLDYEMQGPFAEVGRRTNNGAWESDMEAVHHLARQWHFTGDDAYAQKARDILIAWATTHTLWNDESGTYLTMGYEAMHVFEGADILRGAWSGWTEDDTETMKTYFENVWWDEYHLSVPHPLRSANQGMSQLAAAVGVAIFNDDQEKFNQCLEAFLNDAPAALGNTLPNGQVGDTGRDAHDQGQLMLMVWVAEALWDQGVDVYSALDNRMLAAAEYLSRFNLLVDTPFIQAGTVYDIYTEIHVMEGEFANYGIESKMLSLLYQAYIERKGMSSPYLETYFTLANHSKDTFCYLNPNDTSTALPSAPLTPAASALSVTSLEEVERGNSSNGSANYNAGTKSWTVSGGGSSLAANSADYHFAYLPVSGDATIIARLVSLSGSNENARAGVVFSETLDGDSTMQGMVISNPSGDEELYSLRRGAVFGSGDPDGGAASHDYPRMSTNKVPYWLKIERKGNRINSYSSPDGASWSAGESADYDLGEAGFIGLAVSAGDGSSLATATFSHVRMTGGDGGEALELPPAPFAIYASPGGDDVPLRWLESFEGESYKLWRATSAGGSYNLLGETTGSSFIDTDVTPGAQYYYAVSGVNAAGEGSRSPVASNQRPYLEQHQGENYDAQSGVSTESTRDFLGGLNLSRLDDGDWVRFDDVTIEPGAVFQARCAGYGAPVGFIELRLGSPTGTLVGTVNPIDTGGPQSWGTTETPLLASAVGTQDLVLVFKGQSGGSPGINFNWFDFIYP